MSIIRHHNEWLSLVPNSGPFLSLPVLARAFPQGLDAHDADHARRLRMAFDEWDDNQLGHRPDPGIHQTWIKLVLAETLGYDELLAEKQEIPQTLKSEVAEYGVTLKPDWIVNDPATKKARLLVQVYPRSQSLTKPVQSSRWKTSPDTRMMQLLHDTGIRLGIVSNGDHWMLVNAPKNETTGYASWYANLWLEEPVTLRAFRTLLCADRFFSVPENETLEALLDQSAEDQQEVTDQLGYQVRKAVEVLIQALDKADQDHGGKLLTGVDEKILYESALTVMMRLVFLFCAEERELLLLGDDLYDKNYAVSTLREQLRVTADQFGEEILGLRYDAWTRLLTTFRAVYAGAKHDRLKLPAYGGSLFNPDRFPFLEGRKLGTSWKTAEAAPLPVSNRTVLHLLEALQVLQVRLPGGGAAEARKLSFRELNIEQIGHVYEGLLDHTAKRATEPVLGLQGTRDKEPEIPLAELEKIATKGEKELLKFLNDETGRSEPALKKALKVEIDDQLASRFRTACQDSQLWKKVKTFAGLVRLDTTGYPVVITTGSVFVTAGTDRRSSGTHYTPKSLTEPIVQYTLEPLVYIGPAEGLPKDNWKLRSAKELLDLKICDLACGSGAFLVQGCRYMAARLLEAWDAVQQANPGALRITPEGEPSTGQPGEMLIPDDPDERQTYALRIVAQRCLFGVDKNPLAVEMAKLSLWLLTLAKDKPFEFLDHAIRCGDSLVGIHHLDQLKNFNLDPSKGRGLFTGPIFDLVDEAVALRSKIEAMPSNTVEDVEAQQKLLAEAEQKTARLRCTADLLLSVEFQGASAADKQSLHDSMAIQAGHYIENGTIEDLRQVVRKALKGQQTFHWPLEFPEVLLKQGGFDAFLCNPPFLGNKYWASSVSPHLQDYALTILKTKAGRSDLCSLFFRRGFSLLNSQRGIAGLIGCESLREGDSLKVSLVPIAEEGRIIRAYSSMKWPGTASVRVCVVWFTHAEYSGGRVLNEEAVDAIDAHLTSQALTIPKPLHNAPWGAKGSDNSRGECFILQSGDMWLDRLKRAKSVFCHQYVTADDLTTYGFRRNNRWVVDTQDLSLEEVNRVCSATYRFLVDVVSSQRQPSTLKAYKGLADRWWQLWGPRTELYRVIREHETCIVVPVVSKYMFAARAPSEWVFTNKFCVLTESRNDLLLLLLSSILDVWIRAFSGTLDQRISVSLSNAISTLPLPNQNVLNARDLETTFHAVASLRMESYDSGFTDVYNTMNDPEEKQQVALGLRESQVAMDLAVAAAYGWTDLDLGHDFHQTKQGLRYTISEPARREILARLLKLNHERYAEEEKQGLHEKKKPKASKKKAKADDNLTLFESQELG